MAKHFNGVIDTDVRDSVPDWDPYVGPRAPEGAPNVLIVLYDDTGAGGLGALRRADRDAHDAAPGRQRADLLAVAHHGAVLARPARAS